jgi:CheY-like chemotaxis protein
VRIAVTDTGTGIPVDQLEAVFEPFVRLASSTARTGRATGLGLAVSRRLAEAMGGALTVSSQAGRGSTFSCTVPFAAARDPEPDPEAGGRGLAPVGGHDGVRLLLVEDDRVNQTVAIDVLTGHGYRIDVASNGMQAVTMSAQNRYAAILMDCHMPLMDGFAATAAIRGREVPGERIPIIALTASSYDDDRERCHAAGMDDFVAKPLDFEVLATTVARWTSS